ncbi:MFS transporter [Actinomadura citrea]|uniref:EmrB/QacA subfamily drug resistance transporter n=1 Tax=Actinomadura citrea TaxID=46158 RepID=A0A7Y9G5W9_9ACTN|nr:MFS transporter [Actinomadura citrea]NYE10572.1 EmrB/QacA subfamily drug resistance transporter [Actinomadura citrea]GGT75355.1 MFS transporter [Actinomadura citrea]
MEQAPSRPPTRAGLRLALLAFTQLIVALDYNIVYVALPDVAGALGFTAASVQWVVSAYAVGLGGLLLFGGRAVDRLGPRRMFMLGLALYGVASLAGGLAPDAGVLIAARAVQGVGGALLTPATLALIYRGFAEGPERNRALGAWGMAGSAGLAAGSLLGGVLTNYLGWEWVFFVNVPLALGAALAALRLLATDPPRVSGFGGFDLPGALLATAGSVLLVLGLASGPEHGWGSLRGAGALTAGTALLGALLVVESRTRDPLVPPRLLRNRGLATTMAVIAVFQGTLGGGYYVLTSYLQPVLGYSALEAGLTFLPLTVVCMAAALKIAPAMLGRWGVRTTLSIGMLGAGAGIAVLVAGMPAEGGFWTLMPGSLIWGVFGGVAFVALFASAGAGITPHEQGVASGLASTAKEVGGAMGLAVFVAVATAGRATGPATPGLLDGLHTAGWAAAAVTAAGGLIALALKPDAAKTAPGKEPDPVPVEEVAP